MVSLHTKTFTVLLILTLMGLNACQSPNTNDQQKQVFKIVATTGMIGDVVANIAGNKAQVSFLMGPGVDPHLYKATKSDLDKIREADLIFYNGIGLEAKMAEVFAKVKEKKFFAVGESVPKENLIILDGTENETDPHFWLDIALWAKTVDFIAQKLGEKDAANRQYYADNAAKYKQKLLDLDKKVRETMAAIPEKRRVLVTAHDAFGYFSKAYNVKVKSLQGISTATEFGLKDIAELVDFIVKNEVKAVFVESFISPKSLEAVVKGCGEKGHKVKIGGMLYTDAVGEKNTPEATYIGMIEANLRLLSEGLK